MTHTSSREELLWKQFAAPLRRFVARRVPTGIEPDDVVQDVFLRVVRHLDDLRDSERLEGWLFQIARNAIRDALRTRQRRDSRTEPLEADVLASPEGEQLDTGESELAPCLTPLIRHLAEPYRTAIELTAYQGLTQTEAATRLGVSVSGMKSRVQRARAQLKEMLLACCEVELDRRGGVSDYRSRTSSGCPETRRTAVSPAECEPCSAAQSPAASIRGERRLYS